MNVGIAKSPYSNSIRSGFSSSGEYGTIEPGFNSTFYSKANSDLPNNPQSFKYPHANYYIN